MQCTFHQITSTLFAINLDALEVIKHMLREHVLYVYALALCLLKVC